MTHTRYPDRAAPPAFVRDFEAWDYVLDEKLPDSELDEDGNPRNYAAAIALYKNVARKWKREGRPHREEPVDPDVEGLEEALERSIGPDAEAPDATVRLADLEGGELVEVTTRGAGAGAWVQRGYVDATRPIDRARALVRVRIEGQTYQFKAENLTLV